LQFVYYTEKTVPQCLSALNERMNAKASSTRPAMDGWVEKNGQFSIGVSTDVAGRFRRSTYLRGKLEKLGPYTAIKCNVSNGATRENLVVIFVAMALTALALIASGNILMALIVLPVGSAFYVPLTGDYHNSEVLLSEIQKTLKAKTTPPKPSTAKKSTNDAKKIVTATPVKAASSALATKPVAKPAVSSAAQAKPTTKPAVSSTAPMKPAAKPAPSNGSAAKPAAKPATSNGSAAKPVARPATSTAAPQRMKTGT
jgi:hypothetical protein